MPGARPIARVARIAIRVALATAILGFVPGLFEPFMPFKAMVLRVTGFGLLAWVAVEGWGGRVRRPDALTWSVLAWVIAGVMATLGARSPQLALMGEVSQREGLLTVVALAGLHLAAAHAHRHAHDVRDTLRVVMIAGVVAAVYAQSQLAGLDPVRWSGIHTFVVNGAIALRPSGSLGSPVLLGVVLAATLPLVLARLAEARSDAAWLVPAAALLAATLLMTLSRGAWLAGALGASVAVTGAIAAGARPRRLAWTLAASLSPAVLFGLGRSWAPLVARLSEGLDTGSGAARAAIARGALQLWSERPWFGVGLDGFGLAFPRVQEPALWRAEWIGLPVHAHSVILQVLATMGVAGALAGTAWIVASLWALFAAWRRHPDERPWIAGLAGGFVALLVAGGFNVLGLAGAALFAVCTALPGCLREQPERVGGRSRPWSPMAPALAAMIIAIPELVTGMRELAALAHARPARDELSRAGFTPSEWTAVTSARAAALRRATAVWPHDDVLWRLACEAALGVAALPVGDGERALVAAERAARRAVAIAPLRAASHVCLGDALAARALRSGSTAVAESAGAAYGRAEQLAPADGWVLVAHARFELAHRDGVGALEVAQRLIGIYPEAAAGHTLAGAALMLLHRPAEAVAALERARAARWEDDAGSQRAAVERLLESASSANAREHGAATRQRRRGAPR